MNRLYQLMVKFSLVVCEDSEDFLCPKLPPEPPLGTQNGTQTAHRTAYISMIYRTYKSRGGTQNGTQGAHKRHTELPIYQ